MHKYKYLKIVVLLAIVGVQIFSIPISVKAIQLVPESAVNLIDTDDHTVKVVSSLEEEVSGMELRLSIEGGEFVSYQPPTTSGLLVIGTCGEDKSMSSSTNVCVDIVNTNGINQGDDLGQITYRLTNERGVIYAENKNRYTLAEGSEKIMNTGIAGEYSSNAVLQNENNIGTKNQEGSIWVKPISFLADAPFYFIFFSIGIVFVLISVLIWINKQPAINKTDEKVEKS